MTLQGQRLPSAKRMINFHDSASEAINPDFGLGLWVVICYATSAIRVFNPCPKSTLEVELHIIV